MRERTTARCLHSHDGSLAAQGVNQQGHGLSGMLQQVQLGDDLDRWAHLPASMVHASGAGSTSSAWGCSPSLSGCIAVHCVPSKQQFLHTGSCLHQGQMPKPDAAAATAVARTSLGSPASPLCGGWLTAHCIQPHITSLATLTERLCLVHSLIHSQAVCSCAHHVFQLIPLCWAAGRARSRAWAELHRTVFLPSFELLSLCSGLQAGPVVKPETEPRRFSLSRPLPADLSVSWAAGRAQCGA